MIKILRKLIILGAFVILIVFLLNKFYSPIEIGEIKSIRVDELKTSSMKLGIILPVENKTFIDFEIYDVDLSFSINGVEAGQIHGIERVKILANSTEEISFPAELKFQDFLLNFLDLLKSISSDKAEISLKGKVVLKFLFLEKEVWIDKTNIVPLKK